MRTAKIPGLWRILDNELTSSTSPVGSAARPISDVANLIRSLASAAEQRYGDIDAERLAPTSLAMTFSFTVPAAQRTQRDWRPRLRPMMGCPLRC
jgi:hypothetical protein